MTAMLRPLSPAQARECEMAVNPECTCRCGGSAHGKGRITMAADAPTETIRDAFRALPAADPHHLPTRAESKLAARARKVARNLHARYHGSDFLHDVYPTYGVRVPCPMCVAEGRAVRPPVDDGSEAEG